MFDIGMHCMGSQNARMATEEHHETEAAFAEARELGHNG